MVDLSGKTDLKKTLGFMDHMGLQAHEPMKSKANILGDRIDLDHVKNSKSSKHTVPWELAYPHDPIKHTPGCSKTCSCIEKWELFTCYQPLEIQKAGWQAVSFSGAGLRMGFR